MTVEAPETVRVILADDDPELCQALGSLLDSREGIDLVATVHDGSAVLDVLAQRIVDVVLLDVNMPVMDGIETARRIAASHPEVTSIMLTAFERDDFLGRSLAAGARGFLTKDTPVDQIVSGIRAVYHGGTVMSERPVEILAQAYREHSIRYEEDAPFVKAVEAFPPSLKEVFDLLIQISTNRQIATATGLAESTVREYVSQILSRTGCSSRGEVAVRAVAAGIG